MSPRFLAAGESALVVEYGETADPAFHDRVLALDAALAAARHEGVLESVPTYRSLMIHYDPARSSFDDVVALVRSLDVDHAPRRRPSLWRVPACYDGAYGEDLDAVAARLNLDRETIVEAHAGARYRVVMYGFAPGFVFLAGLPEVLRLPRRETPRPPAPAGALTIAAGQALIASVAMPTGWWMLGRTPARTFDPARDPMFPIAVGDEIVFERVAPSQFDALAAAAEDGVAILRADAP